VILENLSLTNYRGLEQLEIDFHPRVNVIAGINGVGKSSILHALRALFSRALGDVAIERFPPVLLSDDDVQTGSLSLGIAATFSVQGSNIQVSVQRTRADEQQRAEWLQRLEEAEGKIRQARQAGDSSEVIVARLDAKRYKSLLDQHGDRYSLAFKDLRLVASANDGTDFLAVVTRSKLRDFRDEANQPLVVYYSPLRHIFSRVRTLPEGEPLGVQKAFENALEETEVSFRYFMHWFKWLEQADNKATKRRRNSLANALREAVTVFIPEFKNLRVDLTTRPRLIVDKNELELHLHPSWQRKVITQLLDTFKSCQFILTTHSPQIIGQIEPNSLILLLNSEDKIVFEKSNQSIGMDSNWILSELMDADERDPETKEKMAQVRNLIAHGDTGKAKEMLNQIEIKSHGVFPVLQSIKSMIDRIELLKEKNAKH
jgi:predicted ATP-binding protein involved in virulence